VQFHDSKCVQVDFCCPYLNVYYFYFFNNIVVASSTGPRAMGE